MVEPWPPSIPRHNKRERKHPMICDNITTAANGHLLFAGQDTVDLAKQYGTPCI